MFKLYNKKHEFLEEVAYESKIPKNFTGIVEYDDGDEAWFQDGSWHCVGAPAYVYKNGREFYYVDGNEVSKEQHDLLFNIMKLKKLL